MKAIAMALIFLISFASLFFTLSLFAMLWTSYYAAITNDGWFIAYTIIFGWLSIFPCREYYMLNKEYFDTVFG